LAGRMYFLKNRTTAIMKITVLSKLNSNMPIRMLRENNSFNKKYSETISRSRINMKTVSFFINKKKGCDPAAVPLAINCSGIQYWFGVS
jgi:hypothetical protein